MNSATSYGRLSESVLLSIWGEDIAPIVFRNARNDDAPVSIWLGGQPGAGKSSAARCVCGLHPNRSIVVIDGDDYRQYHPQFLDVAEANPNYKSDENGWLYSKDGKIMYFAYLIGDEFVIPDGVEKVYKNGLYLYEDGLAKGTGTVIVGEDRVKFF